MGQEYKWTVLFISSLCSPNFVSLDLMVVPNGHWESVQIDSDEDGKKKTRAPISAERKLKKKVAFRRKRAEKEKELGVRRLRIPANTFKPKIPLCKFYIKGRCTLVFYFTLSVYFLYIGNSKPWFVDSWFHPYLQSQIRRLCS